MVDPTTCMYSWTLLCQTVTRKVGMLFHRLNIASAKAVVWSDCKMGRNNESGMLFGATVNAER